MVDALRRKRRLPPPRSTPPVSTSTSGPVRRQGGEGSSLARGSRENWLEFILPRPARLQWAGRRDEGQTCPSRAADEDGAEAREDLTPSEQRHRDLRRDENEMITSNGRRDGERGRQ